MNKFRVKSFLSVDKLSLDLLTEISTACTKYFCNNIYLVLKMSHHKQHISNKLAKLGDAIAISYLETLPTHSLTHWQGS